MAANTVLNYLPRKSFVHSLTGTTKLAFFLLFTFASMITYDTRVLIGLGPLMVCPALAGLAVTVVLRYRSGKARGGLGACVALAGACVLLLIINLYVGIPSLLRNFGG